MVRTASTSSPSGSWGQSPCDEPPGPRDPRPPRLISGAADGVARVWALDIELLLEIARSEVTRSLTTAECQRYHVNACS